MQYAYGDMLKMECDALCITTNGYVKANGECVMGRGIAKQVATLIPSIPRILGGLIQQNGNVVNIISETTPALLSFPVKPITDINTGTNVVSHMVHRYPIGSTVMGWACKARLDIIENSLKQLVELANTKDWQTILLPRVGCGAGELEWLQVKPLLEKYLDDRFHICDFKEP